MDFVQFFAREWNVIWQAPITFIIAGVLLFGAAYATAAWRFGRTIEMLRERIGLRDDRAAEYERKLQGASPDEAKAQIEKLRAELAALAPPRLSDEQKNAIIAVASKQPAQMQVIYDGSDPNCAYLAQDFAEAFQRAGWQSGIINAMGQGGPPRVLATLPQRSKQAEAALDALHKARINYDVEHGDATTFGVPMPDLAIELRLPLHRR